MSAISGTLTNSGNSGVVAFHRLCNTLTGELGGRYASALGIKLVSMEADEIFKWFLVSVLFGARIGESVVLRTFNEFERAGALCPETIIQTGWDGLVSILDRGGYARYDFKTATKLMEVTGALSERYAGDLNRLHFFAQDEKDLERKLQGLGKGIGPVTVNIFLRELRNIWEKAEPPLSEFALCASRMLGLTRTTDAALALEEMNEMWQANEPTGVRFPDFEAALTRLGKNYCIKNRCNLCVVTEDCQSSNYRKGEPGIWINCKKEL